MLKAIPKLPSDRAWYREINVMIDPDTFMTRAIRLIQLDEKNSTVYVLDDPKINREPRDRDRLLHPDLSGLRIEGIR